MRSVEQRASVDFFPCSRYFQNCLTKSNKVFVFYFLPDVCSFNFFPFFSFKTNAIDRQWRNRSNFSNMCKNLGSFVNDNALVILWMETKENESEKRL